MSIFIDTGVFFAHHDTDAARHDAAFEAFDRLLDGEYGQPYTSDYILDETITLTRVRTDSFDDANTIARRILGEQSYPDIFEMLKVDADTISDALSIFRRYHDHDLSFTDSVTIALCRSRGIDSVLSFDDDFDGLVKRVDPAVRR